jgi:hypothetical protein
MCTDKKSFKIFVRIPFKNKTKSGIPFLPTIISVPCKFQQNSSKKMALGINGLTGMSREFEMN